LVHNTPPRSLPRPSSIDFPADRETAQNSVQRFIFQVLTFAAFRNRNGEILADVYPHEVIEFCQQYQPTSTSLAQAITKDDLEQGSDAIFEVDHARVPMNSDMWEMFEDVVWYFDCCLRGRMNEMRAARSNFDKAFNRMSGCSGNETPAPTAVSVAVQMIVAPPAAKGRMNRFKHSMSDGWDRKAARFKTICHKAADKTTAKFGRGRNSPSPAQVNVTAAGANATSSEENATDQNMNDVADDQNAELPAEVTTEQPGPSGLGMNAQANISRWSMVSLKRPMSKLSGLRAKMSRNQSSLTLQ
jgi:hypothetical protein